MDAPLEPDDRPVKRQKLTNGEDGPANGTPIAVQTRNVAAEKKREERAGITAYVNPSNRGFEAVLKTRYTDFLVNEISLSGQILHLQSLELPAKLRQGKPENGAAEPAKQIKANATGNSNEAVRTAAKESISEDANGTDIADLSSTDQDALKSTFGDKTTSAALNLDHQVRANPNKKARDFKSFHSPPIDDKQARTDAHQLVRRVFASRIETNTEDDNTIKFSANPQRGRGTQWTRNNAGGRAKGKLGWDELGGEYLHFTLYKENKDTMEAVGYMCSQMKVQPKTFQYPGTKDRRAVTVQRMAAYRIQAERLYGLNKMLRGARMGDYKYEPTGLELGDLSGNAFTITLRDCRFAGDEHLEMSERTALATQVVEAAISGLRDNGFINYYGLQRFGSFESSTDFVGKLLLRGDYGAAVDSILDFTPAALKAFESEETANLIPSDERRRAGALKVWKTTSNASAALEILPRKYNAESNIIRHLGFVDKRTGAQHRMNDFQGALHSITRNLRLMYVHAYQSLVWNTVASKRWELYGSRVVEGDLIISNPKEDIPANGGLDYDEQGEIIVRPAAHDKATDSESAFERARPLTKDEANSGKFSIFDVVLALPGYDVEYPKNDIGAFYEDFMGSEEGGQLDPHDMRRGWRDISLPGGYRNFMAKPSELGCSVRTYRSDFEQMVETDFERLLREGKVQEELRMTRPDPTSTGVDIGVDAPEKVAVIVSLQLSSSQYATMALREMTKGGVMAYQPDYSRV